MTHTLEPLLCGHDGLRSHAYWIPGGRPIAGRL